MTALPSSAATARRLDPASFWEQGIWRADELDTAEGAACPSGHPALDAELPGGGWPQGALTEVLQPAASMPTVPLWPLLLPALAQTVALRPSARVVLVAPPLAPFAPALAAGGLPAQSLLCVHAESAAERLWATEQALRCADVGAVLVWLPQARTADLRRLQLAAARQGGLLFAMRPTAQFQQAQQASPARLRLWVDTVPGEGQSTGLGVGVATHMQEGRDEGADTGDAQAWLSVHLLKRRGPPAARPVHLPAQGAALLALLAAARARRRVMSPAISPAASETAQPAAGARVLPWPRAVVAAEAKGAAVVQADAEAVPALFTQGPVHALDRTALVQA